MVYWSLVDTIYHLKHKSREREKLVDRFLSVDQSCRNMGDIRRPQNKSVTVIIQHRLISCLILVIDCLCLTQDHQNPLLPLSSSLCNARLLLKYFSIDLPPQNILKHFPLHRLVWAFEIIEVSSSSVNVLSTKLSTEYCICLCPVLYRPRPILNAFPETFYQRWCFLYIFIVLEPLVVSWCIPFVHRTKKQGLKVP